MLACSGANMACVANQLSGVTVLRPLWKLRDSSENDKDKE